MLNYTLRNFTYKPSAGELIIINSIANDWSDTKATGFKTNLKRHVLLHQFDRCAYCRKIVEADGYYEPLEHIVPQSNKTDWVFVPNNLIVTCDRCNNLKGTEQTLNVGYINSALYPNTTTAFKIFNPYFDLWDDHFEYENDIFISPKAASKGEETIRICKLYKYHVIVNRSKELKLGQKEPLSRTIFRLRELDKNSKTYALVFNELLEAMDHFKDRVEDKFT